MAFRGGISKASVQLFSVALLIIYPLASYSQLHEEAIPTGSRAKSLGGISAPLTDFWSSLHNPANIAFQDKAYQAGFYYENSYLAKELNLTGLGVGMNTKYFNVGICLSRYGLASYNQGFGSIAVGKKVWKMVSVGAKISYHYIQMTDGYGSVAALTGEVGANASITQSLSVGVHVVNPTNENIGNEIKEPLPSGLNVGALYKSPWGLNFATAFEKFASKPLSLHAGVEWAILNNLFARTGYRSQPNVLSFGIGYIVPHLSFDLSITKHETLGYSPQVSATVWIDP